MNLLQKTLDDFDEALVKEGLRGDNPYFPNWEGIKSFITKAQKDVLREVVRMCGERKKDDEDGGDTTYGGNHNRALEDLATSLQEIIDNN